VVTLKAKINGDPKYQDNPLISNFEISVNDLRQMIPFSQLMLYYVTPSTAAVVASVAVYLISTKKKRINKLMANNDELRLSTQDS
jgi:hypothetical protein